MGFSMHFVFNNKTLSKIKNVEKRKKCGKNKKRKKTLFTSMSRR